MVSLLKEQENFLRNAILTVDHSKEVLQCFLEQHLKNNHQTFEDFLNQNQHDIYHLYYDAKCCQCGPGPLQKKKRILFASQMELLFDKNRQLSVHKTTRRSDFCCCYAKKNVTTAVLDLTLARCLLMNCCIDMFWYSCLAFKGLTLEQFLNSNKHMLYHLWKNNIKCCKCQPDFIFPCNAPLIMESEWKKMFSSTLPPCENDRKRPVNGAISICAFSATPSITVQQIHFELQGIIIQYCCSTRKSVEKLAELRNLTFGHVKKASMSCTEFNTFMSEAEDSILDIATVCGKEDYYRQMLLDLRDKPLDSRMFCQYEKVLLQMISNYEDIIKENEVLKDGIESLKDSNTEMKEKIEKLCILHTEGSKRQRLIGETSAEIDNHRKDQTYTEIKAVTACIQMLDHSKVLILSGGEGSGKSKNSIEILRQMKEKHPETDVIKLKRFTEFTDIIDRDKMTIVLFEDVFGRTRKQFSEDTDVQILDSVNSYINLGIMKVIFVMRNTVKQECKSILSSHEIFCKHIAYLDLSSKEFGLSFKEKEQILINYCTQNRIEIIYKKQLSYLDAMEIKIDRIKVSIVDEPDVSCCLADNTCTVVNSWSVENIIRSDPYQGYPQSCRLFTQNKSLTKLGAPFFKYPSNSLLKEIENMRMEGIDNNIKGMKYVILVYVLLNQDTSVISINYDDHGMVSINENNIDVQAHEQLFNACYNKHFRLKLHDIILFYDELTSRYLTRKEQKIYFQHRAVQDSVLISYCKENPTVIIPLLSTDYMLDIVRSQNYMEQEDEIVIKIQKPYYPELAENIISLLMCSNRYAKFMESKVITESDEDLIYQLIVCINNCNDTIAFQLPLRLNTAFTYHYFPLYLLRNIGKIDDEMLTVNHTKGRLLIQVSIKGKQISLCVNPNFSLYHAFLSKYKDIIKWLLKYTDHSLLDFTNCFICVKQDRLLEYTKLLLQSVKHDLIDMTQLFINICFNCNNEAKYVPDWIIDNVDNSLIDYYKCIDKFICKDCTSLVLHILKKVNHRWLNINAIAKLCCKAKCSEIIEWVLKNCNHKLFDEEELLNITIGVYKDNGHLNEIDAFGISKIVELLILQKPEMLCCKIDELFDLANRMKWYDVLGLLFKHDSNLSINRDRIIKDIFKHWDNEEQDDTPCDYAEVYFDDDHCLKIIQLILKYSLNDTNFNKILKKAVEVGFHNVLEELLMNEIENISQYLDITLNKLRRQQFIQYDFCKDFYGGHGKILMLLLQKIDNKLIDLNSIMIDVCHIGHSTAILWLLENKSSYCFDMKYVMNKACYHGDLSLVDHLFRKYSAGDFDFKTAMINSSCNSKRESLNVCKWLWKKIDRDVFDMTAALNNACKYDNTEVVKWILSDVEKGLYDIEAAVLFASEFGRVGTLQLLLKQSSINILNIQSALILSCRNERSCLGVVKLLYRLAKTTSLDINAVLSEACKYYRTDFIQWIIETCDQNITVTETSDGKKNFIECLDKNRVDMNRLITCILDMDVPQQKSENVDKNKYTLLRLIMKQSDPRTIDIHKLLTESCKKDWIEIFKLILRDVSLAISTISDATNEACRNGAFNIVKWSLENIDANVIDLDNIMRESCGYGWLTCLDLLKKHFNRYKFDMKAAMFEACTYNRLHIAEWLLHNVSYQHFDIQLLLQEAGRNGWINIFGWLLQNFYFDKCDIHIAIRHALENGHLQIAELGITKVGKEDFDFSSLSRNAYVGANKEDVVNFLLHNIDPKGIDIAIIMTNACLFGWRAVATFIVDSDLSSLCDISLAFNTACDNGELEIVQLLLDKVDPHILTTVDKAMHSVAVKGWDEISLLLLDKVEHTRLDIGNALIEACRYGEIDVVRAILRKVDNNMLDVETALNKACENHMHEELVLWILENIDQEQVNLKTVKKQATRHKWRKVRFAIPELDTEDLNEAEQGNETDFIVVS